MFGFILATFVVVCLGFLAGCVWAAFSVGRKAAKMQQRLEDLEVSVQVAGVSSFLGAMLQSLFGGAILSCHKAQKEVPPEPTYAEEDPLHELEKRLEKKLENIDQRIQNLANETSIMCQQQRHQHRQNRRN